MNLNCMACLGPFHDLDTVICDGCNRPSHREPCGRYEVLYHSYNEPTAFFYCARCLAEDEQ